MSALDSSFRALIGKLMREQDLSVAETAQLCGLPLNHFVALLHGPLTTTLPEASRILRRLGVSCELRRVSIHLASRTRVE